MNTRQKPSSNETVNESGSEQKRKCNAALRKSASAHSHEATLSLTAQQEELFCSYEYLVSITATKIRLPGERFTAIDVDDLLQIGRIALIRAIQLFDLGRSFKPFAIQLIRNAMLSTIRENMRTTLAQAVTGYFDDEGEEWIELDSSMNAVVDSPECEYEDSHLLLDILISEAEKYSGNRRKGMKCYSMIARGYTASDIAHHYGVSISTVYCWLHDAKEVLFRLNSLRNALGLKPYNSDTDKVKAMPRNNPGKYDW